MMAGGLHGGRAAVLAADRVERVGLEQPRRSLDGAGARRELFSFDDDATGGGAR
jgi:protease I